MTLIKKLDIYVLKNYLMLLAGSFCVSLFAVMMQFLWKYINDLVGKGLTIDVYVRFFFYATETLVPIALPLAILIASLITFGNLGERLELLSIKAAGVSLFRTLRPLVVVNALLAAVSFYFQDSVAPEAQKNVYELLLSMREKSPEVDIPERAFYNEIPSVNLYVRSKNKDTGMLYDVIIYDMRQGANKARIILSDSARLQSSSDKKHMLLHLHNGEQFGSENNSLVKSCKTPYARETFVDMTIIVDFDTNLNVTEQDAVSGSALTKNLKTLRHDIDSLEHYYDSLSAMYCYDMHSNTLRIPHEPILTDYDSVMQTTFDSARIATLTAEENKQKELREKRAYKTPVSSVDIDSMLTKMGGHEKQRVYMSASQRTGFQQMDIDYKSAVMENGDKQIRRHWIKYWEKFSQSLACLLLFFVGAPLGAIIRKGGMGMPLIVAVVIFIIYYVISTLGMKTCREGSIPVWLGMWLSTIVLTPMAVFFTVKANNDSAVFNRDTYVAFFRSVWGIRAKRHITRKEVIINDPDYANISHVLGELTDECKTYRKSHRRGNLFGYIRFIFSRRRDPHAEAINKQMELIVASLSNSRDREILRDLNGFPIMDTHEFRFYRRRRRDMKQIMKYAEKIKQFIDGKYTVQQD